MNAISGGARGVRAILFDAVGTLIYPEPPVAEAYAAAGRRFGCRLRESEIAERFKAALHRQEAIDRHHGQRTSEARERERWRSIVADVFDDVGDTEPLFEQLWSHFAESKHWRVYPEVQQALAELAGRGLVLGLASNFDARLERISRDFAALHPCRHCFLSSSLGWRKPGAEFFRAIAQRLALPPNQVMLVGDDVEADYRAALAAGWRTVLVDRCARHALEPRIATLAELPGVV